jgi:hypothetical protein
MAVREPGVQQTSCGRAKDGLWLLREAAGAYVVVLAQHDDYGRGGDLILEILAALGEHGAELCTRVFDALEQRLSKGSCYRGRVLSLEQRYQHSGHLSRISVHELDTVAREDVILPEATLQAVERNVCASAFVCTAGAGIAPASASGCKVNL